MFKYFKPKKTKVYNIGLLRRSLEALELIEWASVGWSGEDVYFCEQCGGYKPVHVNDCQIEGVIADLRKKIANAKRWRSLPEASWEQL